MATGVRPLFASIASSDIGAARCTAPTGAGTPARSASPDSKAPRRRMFYFIALPCLAGCSAGKNNGLDGAGGGHIRLTPATIMRGGRRDFPLGAHSRVIHEVAMPIRAQNRWLYPIDWRQLSGAIRFGRALSRCKGCGRPHRAHVAHPGDGHWWDAGAQGWRCGRGRRTMIGGDIALAAVRTTCGAGLCAPRP